MKKSRKSLFLYELVALLVLALTGAAWALPTDTTSSEQKSTDMQPASVFKDVQAGDNNLIYINYLAKREIFSGFPDGGFHPTEGLTRAQAATLLAKAAGLNSSEKKAVFKDVDAGHWAAGRITAAANAGYLKGYPDGTYHPEEKLTRAQGISLVLRISKQKDTGVELPALKDLDSKHWAARSVAIGLDAGMVGLSSDKTQFLPDTVFSRGDLSRALAILMTTDPDLSQVPLNGTLEIKQGEVKVNDQAVTGNISIKAGDKITTAAKAEAQLSYPDGSGLLVKENSQIAVKETRGRAYIKKDSSPGIAVDWLLVDLKKGDVFGALATNPNIKEETSEKKTASLCEKLLAGISGALQYLAAEDKQAPWYKTAEAKKVKVKVDMPYGVAAIRGSFWSNAVTSTGCYTSALEGDVQVGGTDGQTVPVPAGQSSSVAQGSTAPTPPAPMTAAQALGWAQQSNWLQTVAQTMQSNQEAVRTEPVITQVGQTPLPGQLALPIPPAPVVPDILNIINQALTQVEHIIGPVPGPTPPDPDPTPEPDPLPTTGITAVMPNMIKISELSQPICVTISSSGLDDDIVVTVQLYVADGSTAIGGSSNGSITGNMAELSLTIPVETPEGWYIIRVSGDDFSTFDSPFLISDWMGLVNNMNLPTAASCSTTALAGDGSGIYAAYVENNPMKPAVKKLDGMSWVDWGPAAIASCGYTDLAVSDQADTGNAFLAYKDNNKARVMSKMYDASSTDPWTDLGIVSVDSVEHFSLTTGENKPYLAYSTESNVQTYVYDSGSWAILGSELESGTAGDISLAWNQSNSKPYLAYSNGNSVYGYVYESAWTPLGSAITEVAANTAVSLAFDSSVPYVAYRDSSDNVMVKMYCDPSWTTVGNTAVGTSTANYVSLAFDCNSTPYVVYSDTSLSGADAGKATVKYCNDGTWETVGFEGFSATAVTEPRIRIIGSDIYVIYKDTDNNIRVMQRTLALP